MKNYFRSLIVFSLIFLSAFSYAQNQTAKWYFGAQAGLDFMGGPTILTNGVMNPWEGCASIADAAGNLLFYTDGIQVWNKNHIQMPNGFGLTGNGSTTQSGVIVQKPGSPNIYYVFTEDAQAAVNGLRYSTVDMSLNAGLGDVVIASKNTPLFTPSDEKITAVRHCNGVDVWVVTHDWLTNNFRTFLVTAAGVGAPVISSVGTVHNGSNANTIGYMKASPNGRKLGLAIHDTPFNAFELYDFNNTTGVVSNPCILGNTFQWAYGCEFSPDGSKFYGGRYGGGIYAIYQWDVCAGSNAAIIASQYVVANPPVMIFAFQLAKNGKIYVCRYQQQIDGVINNPNAAGAACTYVDLGQSTAPKINNLGFPNFVTSFLKVPPPPFTYTINSAVSCLTASFTAPPSPTVLCATGGYSVTGLVWTFGDPGAGALNTSTLTNPGHTYPGPGTYTAQLIMNYVCGADTLKIPVSIVSPTLTINTTSASCAAPGSATVTVGGGTGPYTYTWTPTAQTTSVATNLAAGIYTVTVKDNGGGCVVTGTANLGTQSAMTGTVTTTSVTCNGGATGTASIAITGGTGNYSYTWTPGGQNTNSVTGMTAGTYSVDTKDLTSGCKITNTLIISQPPALTLAVAASSPTACTGSNISLTATGSGGTGPLYTYTWTAGPTTNIYNVNQATGGNYTYSVTSKDANGCSISNTIMVTFINNPTVTASSATICLGGIATLTTTGATTYTWSPGGVVGTTFTLSPGVTTAVTVIGATGACTNIANANITVNPLPVPIANSNSPVCAGQPINFTGAGATTYTWAGPGGYAATVQNPIIAIASATNAGTYSLSVTDANGCKNNTTTNVVVNPLPIIVVNNPVACLNQAINLTANGGATYSWSGPLTYASNVQNPTILNAQLNMSGAYTVTVTTASGCTATAVSNVTVITLPVAVINSNSPVCAGSTLNLLGSGGATFSWNGPNGFISAAQNPSIPNVTLLANGIYSLMVTAGTCSSSTTASITINALPTPTAGSNSPVCVGQPINFTGSAAVSYTWTGPSFVSNNQNPNIPSAIAGNAGTYTFSVTDANGCSNNATTNLVINPLPVIAVNNPTVCLNQTINLTANGGATYLWNGPQTFTSNAQNPTIPNAVLNMSGQYTVTVTSALGCVNSAVSTATVYPLPNPNINSNSPICVGTTLNLSGTGGATYSWTGPNNFNSNAQNPNITNISMLANGVYSLLVSSGSCTAATTASVTINPLPVINFANNNVSCFGLSNGISNANVTVGTGPFTYTWNSIPIQNTANATGLPAGNYTCFVMDNFGCTNSAATQIIQPTVLTLAINSNTNSACAGTPINLNGVAAGGTGPYTYTWTAGPTAGAYAVSETVAGNYTYSVSTTDANGCNVNQTINLTFNPQPTVTATSATICIGQTAVLMASGAASYVWSPGNVSGATYTLNPSNTTNISVVGSAFGCTGQTSAIVVVNPTPVAAISNFVNKGCEPMCVNLTAVTATNIVNYSWNINGTPFNTGNPNTNYCFNTSGDYTVSLSVVDNAGCTNTSGPLNINVYPKPIADFNHAPLKPIINVDPEVTFTDASYNATITNWNWYFMNTAQYQSTLQNPQFTYDEPGTYAVALVVKSDKGCIDTIVQTLIVGEDFGIYVPNAFTPNGDGTNDVFQPKGFGVVKYALRIFDRWGEELFYTEEFAKGWDGTVKGLTAKNDVYTWKINATSVFGKHHELSGHVTLMK